ncbi:hypothetical protein [Thioalbus denitrificans]|uniref:hypothetical protein n=1 Tax=Thioalbus denitrificans TaxID=547122 RepID=UPI0011C039D2|nr:hypothetical protein [Thioalbus denitrificans]
MNSRQHLLVVGLIYGALTLSGCVTSGASQSHVERPAIPYEEWGKLEHYAVSPSATIIYTTKNNSAKIYYDGEQWVPQSKSELERYGLGSADIGFTDQKNFNPMLIAVTDRYSFGSQDGYEKSMKQRLASQGGEFDILDEQYIVVNGQLVKLITSKVSVDNKNVILIKQSWHGRNNAVVIIDAVIPESFYKNSKRQARLFMNGFVIE